MLKSLTTYFSKIEIILWSSSVLLILFSFFMFDRENYLTLLASLIGVAIVITVFPVVVSKNGLV